jgi:magnesium transporter
MANRIRQAQTKIGLKPGALIHVGEQKAEKLSVNIIDYNESELTERSTASIQETFPFINPSTVTWINVNGLHDVTAIGAMGTHFGIHELILADIINTGHRPKLEVTDDHIFVILKMIALGSDGSDLECEHFGVVIGKSYIITFQEREGDVLDPVRERIRKSKPRGRLMGTDYLGHAVIDTTVDHYFVVLETLGERIEILEEELIQDPSPKKLESIYALKRQLTSLRKSVWPLREVLGGLERTESPLIQSSTHAYFRDLYEHVIQVIDTVETMRDSVSGLIEMYMSSVSNRMNEVMKVLTIIATIFIPLGFLAGVYGMNFDTEASPFNMPELGMRYGYPLFWLAALVVGGGLLWYFRRKRWF